MSKLNQFKLPAIAYVLTGLIIVSIAVVTVLIYVKSRQNQLDINPWEAKPASISKFKPIIPKYINVCFVGDNNLATILAAKESNKNVYQEMDSILKGCDLLIGNLENNLSNSSVGSPAAKGYTFKASIATAKQLLRGGFDAMSVANNHTMDYGPDAFMRMLEIVNSIGIKTFGGGANTAEAYKPQYLELHGVKFGLTAFNSVENYVTNVGSSRAGSAYFDYTLSNAAVSEASANSDISIVFPHWGYENDPQFNSWQANWASNFKDDGADLIVGAGPHVTQGNTMLGEVPVFYSLGNFAVCGFYYSPATRGDLLTVKVDVDTKKIVNTKLTQVEIDYYGIPYIAVRPQSTPDDSVSLIPWVDNNKVAQQVKIVDELITKYEAN